MNPTVTVYTSVFCPICKMVTDFLEISKIDYTEVNIEVHPLTLLKLIGKTKRFSVPQTNINGKWIFGFDPVKMLQAVNEGQSGKKLTGI